MRSVFRKLKIPRTFSKSVDPAAWTAAVAHAQTAAATSATSAAPLPEAVTERLKRLKNDVLDHLLDHQTPEIGLLVENPLNFTENLQEMARYYFSLGGKLIRPTVTLLMSSACNQLRGSSAEEISLNQYRVSIVSEMIHCASLVHDDVIDQSDVRRGRPTANARWGNRQPVLVGDFILARATKVLCLIGQPKVISTMAEIVEDLVKGELMQLNCPDSTNPMARFQHYLLKNFYKTGSLFSNSCKSVAMISECDESVQKLAADFGRNLGMAFQLIDDVLDYASTTSELGKPTANDLKQGLATSPVLFAAEEFPELNKLIDRQFSQKGDAETAYELVRNSKGMKRSRELAEKHCHAAIRLAEKLPNGGQVRDCLVEIVTGQLERKR